MPPKKITHINRWGHGIVLMSMSLKCLLSAEMGSERSIFATSISEVSAKIVLRYIWIPREHDSFMNFCSGSPSATLERSKRVCIKNNAASVTKGSTPMLRSAAWFITVVKFLTTINVANNCVSNPSMAASHRLSVSNSGSRSGYVICCWLDDSVTHGKYNMNDVPSQPCKLALAMRQ